ncbi:TrkH family potassium uptake protein [Rodentibacter caecimuris]|uniref:Trk system potassium uptake protein n=1 Tax=Rodentibacter caecimuris TaxID=1796644 RepID=A0ABX3KZP7_9PAST|nr:potassium transporter [Rodentibacter heylii]
MHILSIVRIIGILIMCFSATMLVPAIVALIYGDGGGKAFLQAFVLSFTTGVLLWLPCRHNKQELRSREGFLIVVAFWVVLGSLATLPFLLFDSLQLTLASAIFEAFSGLTTTGATVMIGLDNLPKAILFYRQLLQWLGGMGIIMLAIAIIPLLGVGGVQLYRAEISGPLKDQKIRPRIAEIAKLLWIIYILLTLICCLSYKFSGMNWFNALGYSFSTVANGGFSMHDKGMQYFNSNTIYIISAIFMFISGTNFALHVSAWENLGKYNLLRNYYLDPEFRFFFNMQMACIAIFSLGLYFSYDSFSLGKAFSEGAFQLISMSMTSGYTIFDMNQLPAFLSMLLVFACIIGGCAGSSSGGLKTIRILIMWKQTRRELSYMSHPSLVYPIKLRNVQLSPRILESIWTFFLLFILVFWLCVFIAILCGMSIFDAIGATFATLTNAGPGLGMISQNFAQVPDNAKLVFTFAMVCGRLEIFPLLVLFSPAFWKA